MKQKTKYRIGFMLISIGGALLFVVLMLAIPIIKLIPGLILMGITQVLLFVGIKLMKDKFVKNNIK